MLTIADGLVFSIGQALGELAIPIILIAGALGTIGIINCLGRIERWWRSRRR